MDLQPGDPFSTKAKGITKWALMTLLSPPTDEFHWGVLVKKHKSGDWTVYESLSGGWRFGLSGKGLTVGVLSHYDPADLTFYRVSCPRDLRLQVPDMIAAWGKSSYDYLLILKLLFSAIVAWAKILWVEKKMRRLRAEDFPYAQNSALICTEAPDVGYGSVGVNVIPVGVLPIPNSFKEAELEGRMRKLEGSNDER